MPGEWFGVPKTARWPRRYAVPGDEARAEAAASARADAAVVTHMRETVAARAELRAGARRARAPTTSMLLVMPQYARYSPARFKALADALRGAARALPAVPGRGRVCVDAFHPEWAGFEARGEAEADPVALRHAADHDGCLLYTSPSPRDQRGSRMPSSA